MKPYPSANIPVLRDVDGKIRNAMSVDVEDYFHVAAFEKTVDKADWDSLECRVERNTNLILQLFSDHGIKATFFTLGWVAERYPQIVRDIVAQGHEVASHGMAHVRVTQQTPDEFISDIKASKALLEDVSGTEVIGYRASTFSIGKDNLWAFDALSEAGFLYSSSVAPVTHDLYGLPEAPRFSFKANEQGLVEIPITTAKFRGKNLPCAGGGFFRLLPYPLFRTAFRRVNTQDQQPGIFYFHPWEVDPDQPRVEGLPLKSRFRHYLNLQKMESRLRAILKDFAWGRVDQTFSLR